jgi:hypothetical protein
MGIWAEIKHALNSTIGTPDFAPLDELYIKGKTLVASNNHYMDIYIPREHAPFDVPRKIKMKNSGSVLISANVFSYSNDGGLNVLINNEIVARFQGTNTSGGSTQGGTIYFKKGDELSFKYYLGTSGATYVSKLKIFADVVDTSMLEVIE